MNKYIKQLIKDNYSIGEISEIDRISSGLIHETHRINTNKGSFILQKLHPKLSSIEILEDFEAVTEHLAKAGRNTPRLIRTKKGDLATQDDNQCWRMQTALDGETFDNVPDDQIASEAGKALAQFHSALEDFEKPFKSNFILHETQKELDTLVKSFSGAPEALLSDQILLTKDLIVDSIPGRILPHNLPVGVIHGDPKISNIIFHENHAQAMIDLDTCQRGSVLLDLGDAFRDWCAVGEEGDLVFSIGLFTSGWRGYRSHAKGLCTAEVGYVRQAIELITLELSARFLADYINDSYFSWDESKYTCRRAHNLARAQGQLSLFNDIQKKQQQIHAILSLPV
ncbi:MAG: phosphotransferase [Patescibacteria group bacterium]